MKRWVWMTTTLCTLVCTGYVLANSCWFQACPRPTYHSHSPDRTSEENPLSSEAAWRWAHCQPTHWRACVLQRP